MNQYFRILLALLLLSACSPVTTAQPFIGKGKPDALTDYWAAKDEEGKDIGILVFISNTDAYYLNDNNTRSETLLKPDLAPSEMAASLHSSWHYKNLQCEHLDASSFACTTSLEGHKEMQNMLGVYQLEVDHIIWWTPKFDYFVEAVKKHNLPFELFNDGNSTPSRIQFHAAQKQIVKLLRSIKKEEYTTAFSRNTLVPLNESAARNAMIELQQRSLKKSTKKP